MFQKAFVIFNMIFRNYNRAYAHNIISVKLEMTAFVTKIEYDVFEDSMCTKL